MIVDEQESNQIYFSDYLVIKIWSNGKRDGAPWWTFWSAGVTNTIGPAMGIEALKYISYPGQVILVFHGENV